MNRRLLIKLAALPLAGLALPLAWLAPLRADILFRDIFGHVGLAVKAGRAHCANDPDAGARGRKLIAELTMQMPTVRVKLLRKRAMADLAALDVVVVDGWVMARTEADLCAAVHLDQAIA